MKKRAAMSRGFVGAGDIRARLANIYAAGLVKDTHARSNRKSRETLYAEEQMPIARAQGITFPEKLIAEAIKSAEIERIERLEREGASRVRVVVSDTDGGKAGLHVILHEGERLDRAKLREVRSEARANGHGVVWIHYTQIKKENR